jgi:hypothetical protein
LLSLCFKAKEAELKEAYAHQQRYANRKARMQVRYANDPRHQTSFDKVPMQKQAIVMVVARLFASTDLDSVYSGRMAKVAFKTLIVVENRLIPTLVLSSAEDQETVSHSAGAFVRMQEFDRTDPTYIFNKTVLDAGFLCARVLLTETGEVRLKDISNENIQSLCRRSVTKLEFQLCRRVISSVVLSKVYTLADSSDDESGDDLTVQQQGSVRDMDLFTLAAASEFFTPTYGSSGDSVLFNVCALTTEKTLRVYLQLQEEQDPGVCCVGTCMLCCAICDVCSSFCVLYTVFECCDVVRSQFR